MDGHGKARRVAAAAVHWILSGMSVLGSAGTSPAGTTPTPGPDGIALRIDRGPDAGELTLAWNGGLSPYLVYRSSDPAVVVAAATRIATTSVPGWIAPEGPGSLDFFLVVEIDRQSALISSSSCLTAGTGARAAIELDLRDTLGNPLEGLTVALDASAGSLGPIENDGGLYRALLAAPSFSGSGTIEAAAEGASLGTVANVEFAEPRSTSEGGLGGCPMDGNLRVRVVDEAGLPLGGARVMVGAGETTAIYVTIPGQAPDGANTGVTDSLGLVEFVDFGDQLDGPQLVTAAADGRSYVTIVGADGADVVLPLGLLAPAIPAESFFGDLTNVPAPPNDPIELGVMLPDVSLETVLAFDTSALLADSECYVAGGVAGSIALPGNVYFPAQCAAAIGPFCLQNLPEHEYRSVPVTWGDRRLLALRARAPLASLAAGDPSQALDSLTFDGIGVVSRLASAVGPTRVDIPVGQPLSANLSCTIDQAPTASQVFCLAAGDWDSASDPGLSPGAGRLFVMGFRQGDSATASGPFSIPGVTTVARTGAFSGIDYLGGAVAQYTDPTDPAIPPGTAGGTSAILDRSGTTFDGAGGTLNFDDFLPIRTLTRSGRAYELSPLIGSAHPPADLTRARIERVIDESYTACAAGDSTRTRRETLWEVWAAGSVVGWSLPEPPLGWPRQAVGGELAGLVDPAQTPEDDRLRWSASTFHLGAGAFDYRNWRQADLVSRTTHVTRNEVEY